jgi:hypothetical protein
MFEGDNARIFLMEAVAGGTHCEFNDTTYKNYTYVTDCDSINLESFKRGCLREV